MSLQICTKTNDAEAHVVVEGEVDVSNAAELRSAIDAALGGEAGAVSRITVDLSEVSYMDSTGIGVLVGARNRASEAGVSLAVSNPQRNVARVLSLLGVDKELGAR